MAGRPDRPEGAAPPAGFDAFVAAWNRRQGLKTPPLHATMARWLEARWLAGERRLLLMAFRNSGKSTLAGLFGAWLLHRDPNVTILVMSAEASLAGKMVRNAKRIIERHPLTAGLKPERADQWASDQFTVRRDRELRDPSMLAKGVGANVTGARADVIVCDDVEVPRTSATRHLRSELRNRLGELDYVLAAGGAQIYIGTPHTYYSIYAPEPRAEMKETQPFLDGYARLELPLLDGRGRSRWPERFPDEEIDDLRRRSGPAKFLSQMQLRPAAEREGRLDPEKLRRYEAALSYREGNGEAILRIGERRMVSASCFWDPAYGAPDEGDGSVIAAVFTDADGEYWLHGVRYLEHDPAETARIDEATQQCRLAADFAETQRLPAVNIETNGLGRFLPGLLRQEFARRGLRCAVVERHSAQSKERRIIEAFDALLAARRLRAHASVWETPFIAEMREWRPGRGRVADDGLDAVSGCLLNEPARLPRLAPPPYGPGAPGWRVGAGVFKADTRFQF